VRPSLTQTIAIASFSVIRVNRSGSSNVLWIEPTVHPRLQITLLTFPVAFPVTFTIFSLVASPWRNSIETFFEPRQIPMRSDRRDRDRRSSGILYKRVSLWEVANKNRRNELNFQQSDCKMAATCWMEITTSIGPGNTTRLERRLSICVKVFRI